MKVFRMSKVSGATFIYFANKYLNLAVLVMLTEVMHRFIPVTPDQVCFFFCMSHVIAAI